MRAWASMKLARRWWPEAVVAAGVVLAVLAPVLRRGFVLRYDMVFVPDPPVNAAALGASAGLPRAAPSELLAVALSHVLPADVAQKLLLVAVLAVAAVGAARLVPSGHPVGRIAAGLFYVWNPWIYGRLLLGQWAIMAAYAALPWVFALVLLTIRGRGAAPRPGDLPRPLTALLCAWPVALGGPAMMACAALVVVPALVIARRWRALAAWLVVLLLLSAPWALPLLARAGPLTTDPAGLAAFSARADTPFGAAGSALLLGGIWSRLAAPPERELWWVAACALALTAAAIGGFALVRDRWPRAAWLGLAIAAGAAWLIAALSGTLEPAARVLPALAAARDGTRFLGPLALLVAVGLGALASRIAERPQRIVLAALAAIAPVAVLPSLALGAAGQLRTAQYPAEWTGVRAALAASDRHGDVLSLPWAPFRVYEWNGRIPMLDPAPRLFRAAVLTSDDVMVGGRVIAGENPRARQVTQLLAKAGPVDTGGLAALGVSHVLVARDQPGAEPPLRGARTVYSGPTLTLYELRERPRAEADSERVITAGIGHGIGLLTLLVVLGYFATTGGIPVLLCGNSQEEG